MGKTKNIGIVLGLVGFLLLFSPFITSITGFFISPSVRSLDDLTGASYIYYISIGFALAVLGLILYRYGSERRTVL